MVEPTPHVAHERDCPEERWGDVVSWRTLVSADRTPTQGITMGTAEIQPGAPIEGACHRHAQPEVYFVLTGNGHVSIDDAVHPVEPGSAVFVPGSAWHFVTNTGSLPLRLVYAFAVDSFDEVIYEYRHPRPD